MAERIEIEISVSDSGAEQKLGGIKSALGEVAKTAAGFAVGAALTDLPSKLFNMAQAAADDEANMLKLQTAINNTGTSFDSIKGKIEDRIKAGQDLAFSDDETRNALTALIQETGSAEEGMARLSAAQNLARGTGMDLETAAKLLGKASDENTAVLKRYGIAVEEGATAQDLMNEVDKRFGGQAAAFASTGAADMLRLKDQVGEAQEQLGAYLLPAVIAVAGVLTELVGVISTQVIPTVAGMVSGFASFISPVASLVQEYLGPLLAGLSAIAIMIIGSFVPALAGWVIAMIPVVAQHIALAAAAVVAYAPIIAAMVAVGVAVAALYLAWQTNFLGIQDITQAVIDFITPYITTALDAIQTAFNTVMPIISEVVSTAWSVIQAVFETVFPIIQTIIETYITAWTTIIQTGLAVVQSVFEAVFPVIQAVVETVMPIIATVVGTYIGAVLTVISTTLDAIGLIWGPFWDGIKAVTTAVWDLATGIAGVVQTGMYAVKDAVGRILGELRDIVWVPVWDEISGKATTIWDTATGIVGTVTTGIQGVYDAVKGKLDSLKEYWDGIWDGLSSKASGVVSAITDAWNAVAGVVNAAIDTWNGLSLNFDTGIPGLPSIHWNSPNINYHLPYIGDGGGSGPSNGGPQAQGPAPWVPGTGPIDQPHPGAPPGMTPGTGGGQKPVPPPPPEIGDPATNDYVNPLTGTGNLSGGGLSRGFGSRGGAMTQQQVDTVAQMVAAGVPADQAVAAVARQPGDIYSQATSGAKAFPSANWSGRYAFNSAAGYRKVQMSNGLTGFAATGNDDEWFGGGGLSIIMDGFRVGRLTGNRHVQGARMRRSPVGCGG